MRIKNICLFVLLNMMVVFTSCSDSEDDALRFCGSYGEEELTDAVVSIGENWIRVRGGEGGYAVSSDNKEIAEVSVDKDVVYIRAYKPGVTEIMVTDGAGEKVAIPLYVETKEQVFKVLLVTSYAEIEDGEARAIIEEEVKENILVEEGGRYLLTREKWNKKQYEGKLVVYLTASEKESIVGTFVWDESVKPFQITFIYNNQEHKYELPVKGLPAAGKLIARSNLVQKEMFMGEDLTSRYTTRYPAAVRVLGLEKILIEGSF